MTITCDIQLRPFRHHIEYVEHVTESESNYQNSALGLKARQIGLMGELIAFEYLKEWNYEPRFERCTNHDIVCDATGHTIDVKTSSYIEPPHQNFRCPIWVKQDQHQRPDEYMFVQLVYDSPDITTFNIRKLSSAYILGTIPFNTFHYLAEPTGRKYWDEIYKINRECKQVRVSQLQPPRNSLL